MLIPDATALFPFLKLPRLKALFIKSVVLRYFWRDDFKTKTLYFVRFVFKRHSKFPLCGLDTAGLHANIMYLMSLII